jgi:predicted nucleotidyltransferase
VADGRAAVSAVAADLADSEAARRVAAALHGDGDDMTTAQDFTNELKRTFGDNLVSVVLYGSSVSGDTTKKYSDVDLFVLLKDTGVAALKPALPAIRQWIKTGGKIPLLFSARRFERAADVFSIEFSDIKEQHKVLAGIDPFENLTADRAALRQQLEYELRANLLRLRRHYVETGEKPAAFQKILAQSLSSFSALFRTTLRLLGEPAPATRKEVWAALRRHAPLDVAALEKIWDLRSDGTRLDQNTLDGLFENLTGSIEATIDFVDALK